jgi:acetyl-CoA C-acetyltransferase
MSATTPVIVAAKRTPIGRFMGGLSRVPSPQLGALAIQAVLEEVPAAKDELDELIMGCVLQGGLGQNPARQAGLKAGLNKDLTAFAVNKVCGSSLKTAMLAAQAVKAGDAECIIAGGMESMSLAPHMIAARSVKFGDTPAIDHMRLDGLHCAFEDWAMGDAADFIARECGVTREDQDEFAFNSHQNAAAAEAAGHFKAERIVVEAKTAKQKQDIVVDEGVRADTTLEALAGLRTAFSKDGTVTAGNASQISDGAAAVIIMSQAKAEKLGVEPLARIVSYHTHGLEPKKLFWAPVDAVKGCCEKGGISVSDVDLFELNEAFAAQSVANVRGLEIPDEKVNICGGGIALGHPIGASGARVLVTLLHQMQRTDVKRGVASLCLGGGNAVAMLVERD